MKNLRSVPLLALALTGLVSAAPHTRSGPALPFIHDDYTKALAEARARKVPIFIDAMAPW